MITSTVTNRFVFATFWTLGLLLCLEALGTDKSLPSEGRITIQGGYFQVEGHNFEYFGESGDNVKHKLALANLSEKLKRGQKMATGVQMAGGDSHLCILDSHPFLRCFTKDGEDHDPLLKDFLSPYAVYSGDDTHCVKDVKGFRCWNWQTRTLHSYPQMNLEEELSISDRWICANAKDKHHCTLNMAANPGVDDGFLPVGFFDEETRWLIALKSGVCAVKDVKGQAWESLYCYGKFNGEVEDKEFKVEHQLIHMKTILTSKLFAVRGDRLCFFEEIAGYHGEHLSCVNLTKPMSRDYWPEVGLNLWHGADRSYQGSMVLRQTGQIYFLNTDPVGFHLDMGERGWAIWEEDRYRLLTSHIHKTPQRFGKDESLLFSDSRLNSDTVPFAIAPLGDSVCGLKLDKTVVCDFLDPLPRKISVSPLESAWKLQTMRNDMAEMAKHLVTRKAKVISHTFAAIPDQKAKTGVMDAEILLLTMNLLTPFVNGITSEGVAANEQVAWQRFVAKLSIQLGGASDRPLSRESLQLCAAFLKHFVDTIESDAIDQAKLVQLRAILDEAKTSTLSVGELANKIIRSFESFPELSAYFAMNGSMAGAKETIARALAHLKNRESRE